MKLKSMTSVITKSALVLAACASLNAFAGTAPAPSGKGPVPPVQEDPALFDTVGAELAVGYDTRYYYRGLYRADNTVWAGLNLSVPLTEQLSLGFGALYTTTVETDISGGRFGGANTSLDFSELDLSAALTFDAGFAKFSAVYTRYFYFDTFGGSINGVGVNDPEFGITGANEVGLTASTTVGGLNLFFGTYYDFTIGGWYAEVGADYPIAITPWLSLVPAVRAGYGIDYYTGDGSPNFAGLDVDQSGFTHVLFSLSAPIKLTKSATLSPYIAWNLALQTRNYLNATHDNEIFGGVKLGVTF